MPASSITYPAAVARADVLFSMSAEPARRGYAPLGARLVKLTEGTNFTEYELAYRTWIITVRLAVASGDESARFTCRMAGRSGFGALRSTTIVDVVLGGRSFEGVAEAMAEARSLIIARKDVQASIRKDDLWPTVS